MTAAQVTQDGTGVLSDQVGTLQYVTTVTHNHWHLLDFMRYELQGIDHPTVIRDQKQGFCLAGDPAAPFVTGWCAQNQPTLTTTEIGLMPGGSEVYAPYVEGQEIMIDPTTAPAGRYLLSARIGPTGVLKETRSDNDVASTLIELKWAQGIRSPLRCRPAADQCIGDGMHGDTPGREQARRAPARAPGAEAHARPAPVAAHPPQVQGRARPPSCLPGPRAARTAEFHRHRADLVRGPAGRHQVVLHDQGHAPHDRLRVAMQPPDPPGRARGRHRRGDRADAACHARERHVDLVRLRCGPVTDPANAGRTHVALPDGPGWIRTTARRIMSPLL